MNGLPDKWSEGIGADVFMLVRGVSYNKIDARSDPGEGLIPILRATNIQNGRITQNELVYVPTKYVAPQQMLSPGDLLIATSSGSRDVVGKTAMAGPEHRRFAFGAFCSVARPNGTVDAKWLSYYSQSRAYRDYVERVALGININNFRTKDLAVLPIPIAPQTEQSDVIARLDVLLARSEKARGELLRVPRLIERYKQTVLATAFRGGLTADWRNRNDPAPVRGDRSTIDARVADGLSSLPASWGWSGLERIAHVTGGLTKNASRESTELRIPYLRVANVYANELRLDEVSEIGCTSSERNRTRLAPGDLLIVEGNGSIEQIGRVAVWNGELAECLHQNHLIRVRPLATLRSKFLLYWLLSTEARSAIERVASSSSGLHTLSISKVKGLPVPVTSPTEMDEIITKIEATFATIDKATTEATRGAGLLDRLEEAIFAKAFRGELTQPSASAKPRDVPNNQPSTWVFGYGSLMWDGWETTLGATRIDRASLTGYRRAFNKKSVKNWGSSRKPGPTLGLEPAEGAGCSGTVFEFPAAQAEAVKKLLTAREGKSFSLMELPVRLPDGREVLALTPVNDRQHSTYIGNVPLAARAQMARRAVGTSGACADYVRNIHQKLAELGIADTEVAEFLSLVASVAVDEHTKKAV